MPKQLIERKAIVTKIEPGYTAPNSAKEYYEPAKKWADSEVNTLSRVLNDVEARLETARDSRKRLVLLVRDYHELGVWLSDMLGDMNMSLDKTEKQLAIVRESRGRLVRFIWTAKPSITRLASLHVPQCK